MGGNHTRQILEALREKQPEQTIAGADGLRRSRKDGGREESHPRAEGRDLAESRDALTRSLPSRAHLWHRARQTWASLSTETLRSREGLTAPCLGMAFSLDLFCDVASGRQQF